jgi:MFS transporter, DHA2 family, multidrug resistance protein
MAMTQISTAGSPSPAPPVATTAQHSTHPYLGILGVFLGASVATMSGRLLSVGLADLRGALGLSLDQASWLPTVLNMAMMFSGVFCVFLNVRLGPRRILLPAAAIFTIASLALPYSRSPWAMFALLTIAGLTSGTFYSLTLTFALTALPKRLIIFGLAAYAADIVFTSNIAAALDAWYTEYLSWRWIFWNAAVLTPVMMACVYFGIPHRDLPTDERPSWVGFTYFSFGLALLYGALDQGERLDWFHSGVIVAMATAGLFLVTAAAIRRTLRPNSIANLPFLNSRNIIILASAIFVFRFVMLTPVVLIPGFLGNIRGYRPLETGHALAWVAVPQFAVVWLVALLVIRTNSRLVLAFGLTLTAIGCFVCAHLDVSWAGESFQAIELVIAAGLACAYIGMVASIVLEALQAGALKSPSNIATFSGLMHFVRIFGGGVGVTIMTRFLSVREKFHSNMLGLNVQAGNWITDERLRLLSGGLLSSSTGPGEAQARAVVLLSQQVRAQAYTQAIADGFVLVAWMVAGFLIVMLFLRSGTISYRDLRKMQ